jgi:hypothetical protein
MFNRLFSKKKEPEPAKAEKEQIEEKGGEMDSAAQLWKGLKKKDKGKTFRRLRDVYIQMPPAMANRVKEIDYVLSQTLVETHKNLVLILNQIQTGNEENRLFFEQSEDWDTWFDEFQKKTNEYRLGVKEAVQGLVEKFTFEDSEIKKIETILSGSPAEVEELTGIDKIEDLKSNLIDIGVLLGKESEFKIVQNIMDEPIRVGASKQEYRGQPGVQPGLLREDDVGEGDAGAEGHRAVLEGAGHGEGRPGGESDCPGGRLGVTQGHFEELLEEVRRLKATLKFYHPTRVIKGILGVDSRGSLA